MKLPERSLLITRGVFTIAGLSLAAFYVGLIEGVLVASILMVMLSSLIRRSQTQSESKSVKLVPVDSLQTAIEFIIG